MAEELKVRITADTSDFSKGMETAKKKMGEVSKQASKQSGVGGANAFFKGFSPEYAKFSDAMKDARSQFGSAFSGASKAGKGASRIFGTVGRAAGAALKAAGPIGAAMGLAIDVVGKKLKKVWELAKATAKAFDPQGYAKAAGAVQNSMKKLKTSIGAFTAPIVNGILKGVSVIIDGVTFVVKRVHAVLSWVYGFVTALLQPVFDFIKKGIEGIKKVIDWVVDGFKSLANKISNFLGMGDVFAPVSQGAKDAAEEVAAVTSETSIGLAAFDKLNAISGGEGDAATAEEMKKKSEEMKEAGKNLGEMIREFVGKIPQMLTGIDFGGLFSGFGESAGKAWDGFKSLGTAALTGIGAFGKGIIAGLGVAGAGIWSVFKSLGTAALTGIGAVGSVMMAGLTATGKLLWAGFEAAGRFALEAITAAGSFFITFVINPIVAAIKWLVEKVKWLVNKISGIGNFFGGIGNAVGGALGGVKSFLGLAGGGAVAPNRPAPYILGDNKREYEIVSPVSLMEKAVMSAIAKSGGTGGGSAGPIELVVNLDSRAIARTIYDPLKNEGTRRGTHL